MANPLQPKVVKCLEKHYDAFVVVANSTSKSGIMDVLACVPLCLINNKWIPAPKEYMDRALGVFYGFEIKWKSDKPSELQKEKINTLIDKGGRGYFIRSIDQLEDILLNDVAPVKYELKKPVSL